MLQSIEGPYWRHSPARIVVNATDDVKDEAVLLIKGQTVLV